MTVNDVNVNVNELEGNPMSTKDILGHVTSDLPD